jgi:hypothetical protein
VKLSLRSVGGVTGPVGPVTRSVDLAALPHERRVHASALLEAARPFELPTQFLLPSPRPWDFLYTLTVADGGRTREVKLHLDAAPPALRALVEWLEEQAPDQSR